MISADISSMISESILASDVTMSDGILAADVRMSDDILTTDVMMSVKINVGDEHSDMSYGY